MHMTVHMYARILHCADMYTCKWAGLSAATESKVSDRILYWGVSTKIESVPRVLDTHRTVAQARIGRMGSFGSRTPDRCYYMYFPPVSPPDAQFPARE